MATNTAASFTNHTGNGTAGPFSISFSYLSEAEVDVTVGGVLKTITTHYTFSSATQITFTSGNEPGNGVAIKFQRDTDISAKKVDFQDGSVLTETDLDTNADQVIFAQQEITDKLGGIEEGATADQTNAEIKTAYEANSDTNAFTDADHSKLDGIEAGATGDQTNAEIRAAVEAASDSNVFTDADHSKLNAIEAGATADQTVSEIKSLIAGSPLDASHLAANSVDSSELVDGSVDHSHLSNDCVDGDNIQDDSINSEHYVDGSIDEAHIANNAVTTGKIADAELKTLAGMQSGTASKLADSTALTADIADLNQIDGLTKQTTISDSDASFPTSGAVVDYVAAQIAPIGGLEVIATDAAFPNTQPQSGVVISIADAGGLVVDANGTSTTARTVGGSTVTINNFASNFNSSTVDAGVAIMVSSTGTGQVYNYHKATLKEADLLSLSNDINDFAARYRVTDGEPSSNNDEGDLIYDKQADKMKVFDSSTNAFKEVTSVGDFKFLFLCPNGGSGSPTINGSIATYDLRESSNTGAAASVTSAAQLLVSVNGIVQKPNTGTSAPSEGFAMVDSNTIIFGSNLPTGAEVFVIQIGSAIALQVPADNTVATAKIQNQAVTTAKIADDAVNGSKIADNSIDSEHYADGSIDTAHIADDAVTAAKIANNTITAAQIANGAIGTSQINNDAITTQQIADGAIVNDDINASAAIAGSKLADGGITTAKIADDAVTTAKIADQAISSAKIATDAVHSGKIADDAIGTEHIQDQAITSPLIAAESVTLAKLEHGTSSNDGKFLRANNGADPSFETVTSTTINNNADNRIITGSGTANTLNAESGFTYNDSTGNAGLGVAPATGSRLRINQATATDYNASTAANNPAIIISASSGGGADNKCVGFSINGPNANAEFNAAMVGNGNNEGDFFISMRSGGSRSNRFRMTHDKMIFLMSSSNQHFKILNDGDVSELRTSQNSGNAGMLVFKDGNDDFCGQITSNGANNTTSYNSSSDYRLKTNAELIADGIARIKNLKPYQFEWKSDLGTKVDGFFAHEAQTVVPEAVTGVKDEMKSILYKEGDEIPEDKKVGDVKEYSTTEIKPQTIDQAKLVPLLTAALQEAIAKIETLETKVAALEAK